MARKPGVMIYFDIRGILNMLTLEERGSLFSTIMEYGETGRFCERDLCDKARIVWPFVQSYLDRDDDRYRDISQRNRYASYVRWQRERGEEALPRHDWELYVDTRREDADA